jgi:hypothetical protein
LGQLGLAHEIVQRLNATREVEKWNVVAVCATCFGKGGGSVDAAAVPLRRHDEHRTRFEGVFNVNCIADGVLVAGNPCRVIRTITEKAVARMRPPLRGSAAAHSADEHVRIIPNIEVTPRYGSDQRRLELFISGGMVTDADNVDVRSMARHSLDV